MSRESGCGMEQENQPSSVKDLLLKDRRALLDLSTRNRLLNVPLRTKNVRTVEIVDEKPAEVYRLLEAGKALTFLPGRALTEEERAALTEHDEHLGAIPQPDDDFIDERGFTRRHSDTKLQTKLTSEGLQKRLFDIWYDARTLEEEQGVNILFLGLGLLKWYDADSSDTARHAPLVLLPVQLDRTSAAEKFKLVGRGEPASPNLSLQAKMKAEFGFVIEDFADEDELDLNAYFNKVAATVSTAQRWEVLPDAMVLGFFSFAKFLMYRDLDPENWPSETPIDQHSLIVSLLRDGFDGGQSPIVGDDEPIDLVIPPIDLNHVVDADSSQAVAVEEAARGRTMVVKGPPGTGKSQTITNIIAAAAAQGKRVLFVAEKMAALDVVHRRLQAVGLGPLTLELHSNKANKRAVLDELKRTKELTLRSRRLDRSIVDQLGRVRDELNEHAARLHTRHEPCELSAFQVMGRLMSLARASTVGGYSLQEPETWTPAQRQERERLVQELADRVNVIGDPRDHPWRGVEAPPLDPNEMDDLERRLAEFQQSLTSIRVAAREAEQLGLGPAETFDDIERAAIALRVAAALPDADRAALAASEWRDRSALVLKLPEAGSRYGAAKQDIAARFHMAAWNTDPLPIRSAIATKGRSLFRFLDSNYRAQIALLRSLLSDSLPKSQQERLDLLDQLISAQEASRDYHSAASVGPAYGQLWQDEDSDWSRLMAVADWWSGSRQLGLPQEFLTGLAGADQPDKFYSASGELEDKLASTRQQWISLVHDLQLDGALAFGTDDVAEVQLSVLFDRLAAWRNQFEAITRWIAFAERARAARALGLARLVAGLLSGDLQSDQLLPTFERSYYEAIRTSIFARYPELKSFDGELHDRRVARFCELDQGRIELAKEDIAHGHWQHIPRGNSGIGPLGVLNGELAKKRKLLPIRQLMEKAGLAIQQIKPIFMMSPLSVAQFLKPGVLEFDVLVMDEASQIEPVDALGSVARAKQIVVVGDERQLPPTRFFAKLTGDDADEDEESEEYQLHASNVESVLDLCLAKGVPHRMLNWHYRSKHQSLIAVSNREFYENRLFIVPSPYDAVAGMGLKFHHLPNAHYDRGNTRTNPVEAKTVAEAVIAHAREHADQSLGVATFSTAQRQAILKELELLRRANPDVEEFFGKAGSEPFFAKNLENIQGDERDVIFISVGYGKTKEGYLAMSFGPLNGEGGERRLNVLISRAKLRCEVFSSITGDDIDLERARSRGVAALKMFLSFAQTGRLGLAEETGRDADSVFEEEVAARLRSLGYDVKNQIGVAGFFVDIAVADPQKPGRFVLGIECDGAQYHSSRSARDRDRLRQAVLEGHGWIIHRIWGADWYLRPKEELEKVRKAIDDAIALWRDRDDGQKPVAPKRSAVPLHFSAEQVDADTDLVIAHVAEPTAGEVPLAVPYVEANFRIDTYYQPHEVYTSTMAQHVTRVVETEGPIHFDEICARIRSLWGLARAGSRIRDAVHRAVKMAHRNGAIAGGPEIYTIAGREAVARDRSKVSSASLRRPEMLPPEEIRAALKKIVQQNFGADRQQLIVAAARAFGFASTSGQLQAKIGNEIDALIRSGQLMEQADILVACQQAGAGSEIVAE